MANFHNRKIDIGREDGGSVGHRASGKCYLAIGAAVLGSVALFTHISREFQLLQMLSY